MACEILVPQPGVQPTSPCIPSAGSLPLDRQGGPFKWFFFFSQSLLHMNSSMPKAFFDSIEQQFSLWLSEVAIVVGADKRLNKKLQKKA